MTIEQTIISQLVTNEEYTRRVLPYLKPEYFEDPNFNTAFQLIQTHVTKYNRLPSQTTLHVDLEASDCYKKGDVAEIIDAIDGEVHELQWLIDVTEDWCQQQAIYIAVHESLDILKDETGKKSKAAIPQLLEDALATTFDTHIGHDYLEDADARFAFYHQNFNRTPFDIDVLNTMTNGGLPSKALLILAGGIGFGKTAMMCHFAAHNLASGRNVLYITLEMAEELIAERIDANLLDVSLNEIRQIPKSTFDNRIAKLRAKQPGSLVIHEYAPGSASAGNFRQLLHDLKLKKNFVPDIIYIDYLNLAASSRIKRATAGGTYEYVKLVAEEVRAIAVDYALPVISATQLNRAGFEDSDPGMHHTSESFGLPATADYLWIIIVNEELEQRKQVMIKQAKNRYGDPNNPRKAVIGRDLSKMRLFNVSETEQEEIMDHQIKKAKEAQERVNKFKFFTGSEPA